MQGGPEKSSFFVHHIYSTVQAEMNWLHQSVQKDNDYVAGLCVAVK